MNFALAKSLSTTAQMLINLYIDGNQQLPHFSEFSKKAKGLDIALEILEDDALMKQRLLTSKLFLEAYSSIRSSNFSNYGIAKEKLLKALEIEPRAAYVHNALGMLYNDNEDYQKAEDHYRKAMELIPSWSFPMNNLGANYLEQNRFQQAEVMFNSALKLTSQKATTFSNLGATYHHKSMLNKAETYLKKSIEDDSTNVTALKNMGLVLEEKGNKKDAKKWYQKAFSVDSTNALREYGIAKYIEDFGINRLQAKTIFEKFLLLEPNYSAGYSDYADFIRTNYSAPEMMQKAEQLYTTAIEKNPHNIWAYAGKGWLYSALGKKDDAIFSFKKGIENNPNKAESFFYLGNFYKYSDDLQEQQKANEFYKKAIETAYNMLEINH